MFAVGQGGLPAPLGNVPTAGANPSPCVCSWALFLSATLTALSLSHLELPWDCADRLSLVTC